MYYYATCYFPFTPLMHMQTFSRLIEGLHVHERSNGEITRGIIVYFDMEMYYYATCYWQSQLEETTKGAIIKEFFPNVESRLAVNLNLSPNVTTIMPGHGNIRSYLHLLKIIGGPECPRKRGTQTADRLILQCKR